MRTVAEGRGEAETATHRTKREGADSGCSPTEDLKAPGAHGELKSQPVRLGCET